MVHTCNRRYLHKIHYHSIKNPVIRHTAVKFAADIIDAFILLLYGDFTDIQGTTTTDILNMFRGMNQAKNTMVMT